jgi:hypothetical protein
MQKQLAKIIDRYRNSSISLESYRAIYDFVEIVHKIPGFLDLVKKDGERTRKAYMELALRKPDYKKESLSKAQSESLSQSHVSIHQMDTSFQYRELLSVYEHLKQDDFYINSVTLFQLSKPDEPLTKADKEEYQKYLDKIYQKVLPQLRKNESQEEIKVKYYDEDEKILVLGNYKIKIAKHEGNNNAHEIMAHIFVDNKKNLRKRFFYAEIAEERFGEEYNKDYKYAYQKFSGACGRINGIIMKATDGKAKDFLEFGYSRLGHIEVNPEYI